MKDPDHNSTLERSGNCSGRLLILLILSMCLVMSVNAQTKNASATSGELYDKIALLDSSFFDAYNKCDLLKIETFFTDDIEFYHEKHGVIKSRKAVM